MTEKVLPMCRYNRKDLIKLLETLTTENVEFSISIENGHVFLRWDETCLS